LQKGSMISTHLLERAKFIQKTKVGGEDKMIDISGIDYSRLDRPEVLTSLFHPRAERPSSHQIAGVHDVSIATTDGVMLGGRFHVAGKSSANILFFHGNGEIVADYDEVGPLYNGAGINFLPVDYRGYGRSTGKPTITSMMRDAHEILHFLVKWLFDNGYIGPLIVMGRSLGSAPALELSANHGEQIGGLIVESGFAQTRPLLELLGFDMGAAGLGEKDGFLNLDKIRCIYKPTLIIHAEGDHLIPFSEGEMLYRASPAPDKQLLNIRGANHNDIFIRGFKEYMEAVKGLATALCVRKQ
ncbi:MAG: alpha/beta hydrolase, partial [Desulfatiglandales bacterium]